MSKVRFFFFFFYNATQRNSIKSYENFQTSQEKSNWENPVRVTEITTLMKMKTFLFPHRYLKWIIYKVVTILQTEMHSVDCL